MYRIKIASGLKISESELEGEKAALLQQPDDLVFYCHHHRRRHRRRRHRRRRHHRRHHRRPLNKKMEYIENIFLNVNLCSTLGFKKVLNFDQAKKSSASVAVRRAVTVSVKNWLS